MTNNGRSDDKVYLRQNVLMEPLINQWYAWPYLVCPSTAAMYVAYQHLDVMQSFVAQPELHISALRNPAFAGGPFINYGLDKVCQIRQLMEATATRQAPLLELAAAIKELDQILSTEAAGLSLEPLYERVPEILKGYVELVYDVRNHASFRFVEGLLYRSRYYDDTSQSLTLTVANRDERSFVFSTPRLTAPDQLTLKIPFSHPGIDELFKAKSQPQSLGLLDELLGIADADVPLFSSLFTERCPASLPIYDGQDLRIRYFGHACLLIETAEVSILTDPAISYAEDAGIDRYMYSDLPHSLDYVLITHQHQDHCIFESLLQLRHKIRNLIVPRNGSGSLADPSLKKMFEAIGFRNVREIDELESVQIEGGSIVGLPFFGEHADLNIRSKMAYLVKLKNRSLLCAADSNAVEPKLYERLRELIGGVDIMFIGMECDGAPLSWLYGPLLTTALTRKMDQSRRFDASDYEKAREMVECLNPQQVYVYAMGQEPWLTYLTSIQYTEASRPIIESNRLVEDCRKRGIVSERLFGQKEIVIKAG